MLALPTRALGSRGLILQRSEGSGMLIGDPLGEGSTTSSTDNELWRAEDSFLRMRGNSAFVFCFFLA